MGVDGKNSLWHFIFGVLAAWFPIIIPFFIGYQLYDYNDVNLWIDIGEFAVGLMVAAAFQLLFCRSKLIFLMPVAAFVNKMTKK